MNTLTDGKMFRKRFLLAVCLAAAAMAPRASPAAEATNYDYRVSVFKQGTSTSRASGSLIGVWNWTGRTFTTQHAKDWQWQFPAGTASDDMQAVAAAKRDPTCAVAAGDGAVFRWTGSTWIRDLMAAATTTFYDEAVSIVSSQFAVAGTAGTILYRWTGITWLADNFKTGVGLSTPVCIKADAVATDFGVLFLQDEGNPGSYRTVYHWTGTSWIVQMNRSTPHYPMGAMVSTDYGWFFERGAADPKILRWTGTSWITHSSFPQWTAVNYPTDLLTIRGQTDFAVFVGTTQIFRWTGTTWLGDESPVNSVTFSTGVAVRSDFAWVAGASGSVYQWTGTSWVSHGPLSGASALSDIDAADTDFAVLSGGSGALWLWRGTSWVQQSNTGDFEAGGRALNSAATAGQTATYAVGQRKVFLQRSLFPVSDDWDGSTGTLYRTVVQVTPTGGDFNWSGTTATEGYFGIFNHNGNANEFLDIEDYGAVGAGRRFVVSDAVGGATNDDILIWDDTVGNWNGTDGAQALAEAGGVSAAAVGSVDVWNEQDRRLGAGEDDDNTTNWTEAMPDSTILDGDEMVLEYWHYVSNGFSEGDLIPARLHVNRSNSGNTLEGFQWLYRVGNYRPRIGTWRWAKDDAAAPTPLAEPDGRRDPAAWVDGRNPAEPQNIAPDGEKLRLRIRVDETDGGSYASATGANGWQLYYSTDQSTWTQVTTTSSGWKYFTGQGTGGGAVGNQLLRDRDTAGIHVISSTASNSLRQDPFTEIEMDYSVQSTGAADGTTYYFQARHGGYAVLPRPGVPYPSVRTMNESTFHFVYSAAQLGRFSAPMSCPQFAIANEPSSDGEGFKVVYVASRGGSSDKVYAVSRTNGSLVRSYSASGTLEYPLVYWDKTNDRYNLFYVQDGKKILALTDNGTTVSANGGSGYASGLLDLANFISQPTRVLDRAEGGGNNYLYLVVTSYSNNTSTLYRIGAGDGSIAAYDSVNNYNTKAQTIGVLEGLQLVVPLYVDGIVYGTDKTTTGFYRIPKTGMTTSLLLTYTETFPLWYTRKTSTLGNRILGIVLGPDNYVTRFDAAAMTTADWTDGYSDSIGQSTFNTGPVSPPFTNYQPVPVFAGYDTFVTRFSGTNGTVDGANFPYSLTGSINTPIQIRGDWMYFGTTSGYLYVLSITNPAQGTAAMRLEVPGKPSIVGAAFGRRQTGEWGLSGNGYYIYFTTADGRIYQFDTR